MFENSAFYSLKHRRLSLRRCNAQVGFCENPRNCPRCAPGLSCEASAEMPCAGTCFGACEVPEGEGGCSTCRGEKRCPSTETLVHQLSPPFLVVSVCLSFTFHCAFPSCFDVPFLVVSLCLSLPVNFRCLSLSLHCLFTYRRTLAVLNSAWLGRRRRQRLRRVRLRGSTGDRLCLLVSDIG